MQWNYSKPSWDQFERLLDPNQIHYFLILYKQKGLIFVYKKKNFFGVDTLYRKIIFLFVSKLTLKVNNTKFCLGQKTP